MADSFLSSLTGDLGDLGSGISAIGGAASDLFAASASRSTAAGYRSEAAAYDTASTLALQNKQVEQASTAIQVAQTRRGVDQLIGGQKADYASAGLAESGSALDVMRSTAQQGSLQTQLLNEQGSLTENAYSSQAASLAGEREQSLATASAADAQAEGQTVGGAAKAVGGILKTVGTIAGIAALFL